MWIRPCVRHTKTGIMALALALAFSAPAATADEYPSKPVRIIVPLSTGSTVDIVARHISAPLSVALKQPVIIDNRPGAGGVNGTEQLVRAPKDGLTIGMTSSNHVINPSVYKSIPFDSLKDITPISIIGTVPLVLVTHPSLPAKTVSEIITLAKAKPGALNYGSAGTGSALHLAGVLFISEAGVDIKHVPYRGTGPLANDLVGGHVEMGFLSVTAALGQVQAGTLRAIATSTTQRSPMMSGVPTIAESGLPKYSFDAWIALIGPAGLPKPIVDRLYTETKALLATKVIQEAFAAQGLTIIGNDPETAAKFFESELLKHATLVKQSGATFE